MYAKAPNSQALHDALGTLEGKALFEGPLHRVFLRWARSGEAIYLDLGDNDWRSVKITKDGWKLVTRPARPLSSPERHVGAASSDTKGKSRRAETVCERFR